MARPLIHRALAPAGALVRSQGHLCTRNSKSTCGAMIECSQPGFHSSSFRRSRALLSRQASSGEANERMEAADEPDATGNTRKGNETNFLENSAASGASTGAGGNVQSSRRYPVPVLGVFAVAEAEVNVATPPKSRKIASQAWAMGSPPDRQRTRNKPKNKPGFKPVAGLGAMLGFLAAGPAGALAGAAASVATSSKDSLAGDTVRTAAKAAETIGGAAWDVTSKAANAANVEGFVRRGIQEVDSWTSDSPPPRGGRSKRPPP